MASGSSMGKVNEHLITIFHPISLNFTDLSSFLSGLKSLNIPHIEAIFFTEPLVILDYL